MHKFLVGFFIFIGLQGISQHRQFLNKPYSEKYHLIGELYSNILELEDSLKVRNKVNSITNLARAHQDLELELEMELLWAYYLSEQDAHLNTAIHALQALHEKAHKLGVTHISIRAFRVLSECYWDELENYEKAFEVYLKMEVALQQVSAEAYPDKLMDLNKIAQAYYYFQDYLVAVEILKQTLEIKETSFNTLDKANALNTLALSYQKLDSLEVSDTYFNAVLNLTNQETVSLWESIAKGNLGYNHFLRNEYELAEPLLQYDYEEALKIEDYGLAAGALIPLSEIALHKENLSQAEDFAKQAHRYIALSGQTDRLRLLFPVLSKLYIQKNQTEIAMAYLDSALVAQNNYHQKFSGLKLVRAQQKIDDQQTNLNLAAFNLERQQKVQERNLLLILILLLFASVVFLFLFYRNKQRAKVRDLQFAQLSLDEAQKNLEIAGNQLKRYAKSTVQKNKYIKQLEQSSKSQDNHEVLYELQKTTILTDDDWDQFQELFEKAHPGFIYNLKANFRQLSQTEIRFLVLTKLMFSTKEMAAALGVSVNAIQVTRHRIRKKLGLNSDVNLESIINS